MHIVFVYTFFFLRFPSPQEIGTHSLTPDTGGGTESMRRRGEGRDEKRVANKDCTYVTVLDRWWGKIDTEEHPDVSRRTTVSNVTFIYRSLFSGLSLRPTKYFTKKKIHIFSFFFLFLVLITLLNKINFSLKIHIHPDHVNKLRLSNSKSHAKLARK